VISRSIVVARNAVTLDFINHTDSVVYLTAVRFRANLKEFYVSSDVSRDIGGGTSPLAFLDANGGFSRRELTLQTNEQARTWISMGDHFYQYRAPWYHRLLRGSKFYRLEYTVMIGKSRYSVSMAY
jgi:hypothetical protein